MDWIVLLSLGLIWGTSYLFIKIAVQAFPPPTLVVIRLGLASLVWCRWSSSSAAHSPETSGRGAGSCSWGR